MNKDIIGFIKRKKGEYILFNSEIDRKVSEEKRDCLQLLLLAHSLEKGSGLPQIRKGFGVEKAKQLLFLLEKYRNNEVKDFALLEGFSALKEYLSFSKENGMELNDIWLGFESLKSNYDFELPASGTFYVKSEELYKNISYENATTFFATRHSFRNFLHTPIDDIIMRKVVHLAMYAPSACNRQPCKVYYTSDETKVIKISHFIEGIRGFEDAVPNWAVVTADRDLFRKTEYFQWYVNGGIFLGYFLQALHACHIGSCTFQTPINYSGTQKLRDFIDIPENETIIAAVGYGYIPKETKAICSSRKAEDKVLVKF